MNIRTYLAQGKPLLFDGAMGTYFASLPGRAEADCEQANLLYPEEVKQIHRAYLESGCQAIKTNTFSLSARLAEGKSVRKWAEEGCRLALEAARDFDAWVFGDMGPVPEGCGRSAAEVFQQQAEWFLEQGVTHFLMETLSTDEGIPQLARFIKKRCPEAFLLVSFAVGYDGMTRSGQPGARLLRAASENPDVDAVGFNCVSGPQHLLNYIKSLDFTGACLSVMPNAGYPTVLGRRAVFQGTPDYFARQLAQLAGAGAAIVGGCCGTTPAHLEKAAQALKHPLPVSGSVSVKMPPKQAIATNPLWEKLERGERVIAVELDPPTDDDGTAFLEGVGRLQAAGADVITIADCPIGRPRADSSLLACKIKRELGVEPLPHMTCRDRNLNAIKALLLGLSMEDVHNVLLVTGDPIPTEHRDAVKSVFNFNSRKLAQYVSSLNESVLQTPFRIFGALNVNARNFDIQLNMACEKEACGVSGFLTQPVLSAQALDNLKQARKVLKGKILGGVFPVVSYRNACFLNNEIAGMRVCDEIVERYRGKEREEAEALALTISTAIAQEIAPYTDGIYLMTPFRRVALMEEIIKTIRRS